MIVPSILSTNFATLKETLANLEEIGVEMVHFDVMDNHFVPNLTFGHKFIKDLRLHSSLEFDTHLMIENPLENIPYYIAAGCNIITTHIEAYKSQEEILKAIDLCHTQNVRFGLSLKPKTALKELTPYLSMIDLVLIMSVEPGFGGQIFLPESNTRLEELARTRENLGLSFKIEIDGGVNKENMNSLSLSGADYLVMGSAFFKEEDFRGLLFSFNKKNNHQ